MEKLQSSSLTVSDNFCASICTLFSFLSPAQKKLVENYKDIAAFSNAVSSGRLIESLVQQSIGFTKSPQHLDFSEYLKNFAQNAVSTEDIDQWRYVVDGPSHSGKSTILSLIAKEAIQGLASCGQLSNVFIFSINWESATQRLTDVFSLYDYIAAQTIFHLTWQYPRIFTIAQSLFNWLLSIPTSAILPMLPLNIQNLPMFPLTQIEVFGKRIFNALKNTDNPVNLVREIVALPSSLAACFGYSKFLFIYDHLDLCNMDVRVSDTSNLPVCILDAIIAMLSDNLFFFSTKAPQGITDCLKNIEVEIIQVENSIPENIINDQRMISCYKPNIKLNIEMCQGCPQFLHRYRSIIQHIQDIDQLVDDSQKKRGFTSIVTNTKMKLAKMETIELCTDFLNNGSDVITENLIHQMQTSNQFTIAIGKSKLY
ncbi:hypothetical protein TRFO_30270 [Tritrichomonas foetus]|uniref:Uncharacterized protein n=1 Tax=Tritrichomonas foetus TaxID=1144522 RepID=A0A1J4JVT5_9EUKA|nr:hypothetical protein TRFO_30270 [Tritrichomonas foetus]|eukprot:OHT02544.1 hypothetical protein TRFO_30270 [Tritrichomonas foetus]